LRKPERNQNTERANRFDGVTIFLFFQSLTSLKFNFLSLIQNDCAPSTKPPKNFVCIRHNHID